VGLLVDCHPHQAPGQARHVSKRDPRLLNRPHLSNAQRPLIVAGEDTPAAVAVLLGLTCENETNGMRKTHRETRIGVLPCPPRRRLPILWQALWTRDTPDLGTSKEQVRKQKGRREENKKLKQRTDTVWRPRKGNSRTVEHHPQDPVRPNRFKHDQAAPLFDTCYLGLSARKHCPRSCQRSWGLHLERPWGADLPVIVSYIIAFQTNPSMSKPIRSPRRCWISSA
jgi:hypothetical protein